MTSFLGRVLAINTFNGNEHVIINPLGSYEVKKFDFGKDTEVYRSCSLQWKNQYYVFGGQKQDHQVSVVVDNRLELKGTLDFKFNGGGCTVLNQHIVVLCFGDHKNDRRGCRQSKNPIGPFTRMPQSNYDHRATRIASFDGKNKVYNK